MGAIEEFLSRYRREFDFYDQSARLLAQQLDSELQASGIRAMVTSRAKQPGRLEDKVRQRATSKGYVTVDDIFGDIVDLAGVRVALYFPAERDEVGKLIKARFDLVDAPREFPGASTPSYNKRFSGYWATHYRVRLRESALADAQKRYADARIEIQVASVLMHAWSEVEHDLVYKPLQGRLSEDEYAILDELNGLVLAGEIALERLQRAAEARVVKQGARFANHYDLAAFLLETVKSVLANAPTEPAVGRVDILFDFLKKLEMNSAEAIEPYIAALQPNLELRPIAEQIIDQMLASDPTRYAAYTDIRDERDRQRSYASADEIVRSEDQHRALGHFLRSWVALERAVQEIAMVRGVASSQVVMPAARILEVLQVLTPGERIEVDRLRRLRNVVVHGVTPPSSPYLDEAANEIVALLRRMAADQQEEVSVAAKRALSWLKGHDGPDSVVSWYQA